MQNFHRYAHLWNQISPVILNHTAGWYGSGLVKQAPIMVGGCGLCQSIHPCIGDKVAANKRTLSLTKGQSSKQRIQKQQPGQQKSNRFHIRSNAARKDLQQKPIPYHTNSPHSTTRHAILHTTLLFSDYFIMITGLEWIY